MNYINTTVFPQTLLTGVAVTYNAVPSAQIILPASNLERLLTRIILITTLGSSDMVSSTYWDGQNTQAPFYLFNSALALSNLLDVTLIGNLNTGEWYQPIRVKPHTEIFGLWLGVLAGSVTKCQATFICEAY